MPRYCIDLDTPAEGFIDSFLIGNGWLGATVKGGIGRERFDLNLDTVWSGGPLQPELGDEPARLLPELRAALAARDYLRADALGIAMQGKRFTESYQPLGGLELRYAAETGADYRRRLDLAEAIASSSFGGVTLESFVSHPDGVLVARAAGAGVLDFGAAEIGFVSPHPDATVSVTESNGVRWLVAGGRVPSNVRPNYAAGEGPGIVYAGDQPDADGTVATGMGFAVVAALVADAEGDLRLIASAASGFRGRDKRPSADLAALATEARARVEAALGVSTLVLRQRHRDDYRGYFERVDLDLSGAAGADAARAELMFHLGRYLMISGSRPGTEATNLQGIWNVDVRPAWSSNYTININTQMNYWPAEAAGLPDLHQPMFALTRDIAVAGAKTAQRYFGARGATAHHNTDLWRFTSPVPGLTQWSNWPSGLYWMAAHLPWHLAHGSADTGFVAETALPVLRAATRFALDMLVERGDGTLAASPSTSPEHSFVIEDQRVAVTQGSAMDEELIHEVLSSYVALADDALAGEARAALARLRLPQVGDDGALLEWDDDKVPAELGHRHLSHLYGVYPGSRITETGTREMFEAVRLALRKRLDNGTGYTGWSQAWVLCLAARLRDAALAEQSIGALLDDLTSPSLLVLHPHSEWKEGFVFQIDGNFGAVAGLIELLVQSHEGAISLLKTLPPGWTEGSISAIRCRCGHQASVTWRDGRLTEAVIVAGKTASLVLDLPEGRYAVAGVNLETSPGAAAGRVRVMWEAEAGAEYVVAAA